MPAYQTKFVRNLMTGESISLEVPQESLDRLVRIGKNIISGSANPFFGTVDEFTEFTEFTFFPTYEEILKIGLENGYTDKLMTQILTEFGMEQNFITKLLEDQTFVQKVKGWFKGIACDGDRAATTMQIIYDAAKTYFSPSDNPEYPGQHGVFK